jgi:hypothetical protein
MSFGAKIAIVIVVGFVLCAIGAVGLAAYVWSRHSGELLEAGRKQAEQGVAFGSETDEAGCLNEAIRRYKANRGLAGSMATGLFVRGCWASSRPTAGFCDQVPKTLDIVAGSRWQVQQTKKAGIHDAFGGQIFAQLRAYCDSKRQPTR